MHCLDFPNEPLAWGEGDNMLKMIITEGTPQGPGLLVGKCLMRTNLRQRRRRYGKKARGQPTATPQKG